jgi:hypothetical protein
MKLYRFSPVESDDNFRQALEYIHEASHELCLRALGRHLPVAENIGFFSHYRPEYDFLTSIRERLTNTDVNFHNKYYLLNDELKFPANSSTPAAIYKYLYVRRPDPYRAQVGDVDFVLEPDAFQRMKQQLTEDPSSNPHARVFPDPRLDMIELHHPDIDVLCYVVPTSMTEEIESQEVVTGL